MCSAREGRIGMDAVTRYPDTTTSLRSKGEKQMLMKPWLRLVTLACGVLFAG
ncbi:hypothetical protein SAMN05216403_109106, partial [Nitrosospira multiformis ATCC 25196]